MFRAVVSQTSDNELLISSKINNVLNCLVASFRLVYICK